MTPGSWHLRLLLPARGRGPHRTPARPGAGTTATEPDSWIQDSRRCYASEAWGRVERPARAPPPNWTLRHDSESDQPAGRRVARFEPGGAAPGASCHPTCAPTPPCAWRQHLVYAPRRAYHEGPRLHPWLPHRAAAGILARRWSTAAEHLPTTTPPPPHPHPVARYRM